MCCFLLRYVNGHAKKHYEETQGLAAGQKKCDKTEKERCQHCVCMDCCSYSTFWCVCVCVCVARFVSWGLCLHICVC